MNFWFFDQNRIKATFLLFKLGRTELHVLPNKKIQNILILTTFLSS